MRAKHAGRAGLKSRSLRVATGVGPQERGGGALQQLSRESQFWQ